jgi:hypothetical protein
MPTTSLIILPVIVMMAACTSAPSKIDGGVRLGSGTIQHESSGNSLDGSVDANYFALFAEALSENDIGGGVMLQSTQSDQLLFSAASADDTDIFVHGTALFGDERFQLPLRFGLFYRDYELDFPGGYTEWASIGPRIEVNPELQILASKSARWTLKGRLGAGIGATKITSGTTSQDFDSTAGMFDVGIGTRVTFPAFSAELGYLFRATRYNESDSSDTIPSTDSQFDGITLTVAVTF